VYDGTNLITADVRRSGGVSGPGFCRKLPCEAGVAAIPSAVRHDDPSAGQFRVRSAFCTRAGVLGEALRRLGRLRPA